MPAQTCNVLVLYPALAQSVGEAMPEEEDLFLARAALQLLAVGKANGLDEKLEDVQELLQSYESIVRHGLPDTPLVHFLNLLIKVRMYLGCLLIHCNMASWHKRCQGRSRHATCQIREVQKASGD